MRLVNWRTLVVAAAGAALAACGDDVTVTPPQLTYQTNPPAVSCFAGQVTAAGISVSGGSGTPTVAFQASGSGFTVTQSGNSVTINCTAAGAGAVNFTITSGSQTVTGSIPVTVQAVSSPVTAVSINPTSLTLVPGGSGQLTATVTLAQNAPANTPTTVTWSSSDTTVATVNSSGAVTARTTAAGRSAVISATSTANANLRASAAVTVTSAGSLVQSLAVSPSAVTLQTGGTQQITANVTLAQGAPAGTSTGVTYTSSDTSIAKVSSTGLITAGSRDGVATITVASVAAPTVTQTLGVTVRAPAPVRLTIQGIRVNTAQGQQPANLNAVAGNVFVTLNLDPGDFRPDSVRLRLGNSTVNCQRFSAELAEAYRRALADGSADVQAIECQLNTASFNNTTGVPDVLNGLQPLTAEVFFRPQGATAGTQTQQAAISQQLTVANQSGYFVQVTNTPTATQVANGAPANGQATGPQGVLWRAGSLDVTIVPVNFTPAPSGSGTGATTLNVTLSDANAPGGFATRAATFATPTSSATVSFPGASAAFTTAPANNTLNGYSSPNAGAANGGTAIGIGGAANTVFLNSSGAVAAAPIVFIDNSSPEPRAQTVSANFTVAATNTGFINGSFVFSDSVAQAVQATVLADNNGVDRVSRSFFVANNAAGITANGIVSGGTATANGGQLAQNIDPTTYVAAARLVDALGNAVNVPVNAATTGTLFTFGVITATPTVTLAGAANQAQLGASAVAGQGNITFTATSTAGASFPTNYIVGTVTLTRPNGAVSCALASDVVAGAVTQVTTVAAAAPPCAAIQFNSVSIDPTADLEGIYTVTGQARDIAGNLSAQFTRTFLVDRTPPVVINPTVVSAPLTGGAAETFSAQATDNFGLVNQFAVNQYQVALPSSAAQAELLLRYDGTAIGTAFTTPFTASANLSISEPTFIRGVSVQTPAAGAYTAVTYQSFAQISNVAVAATDQGNNATYAPFAGGVIVGLLDATAANAAAPPIFGAANGPVSASITYVPSNSSTAAATFATTLRSATSGAPSAVTVNLVLNGTANTPFVSPFTRVELYRAVALPGTSPFASSVGYQLVGSFGGQAISISTTSSTITQSFVIRPGTSGLPPFASSGTTTQDFLVVAQTSNGYAVVFAIPSILFGT